MKSVDYKKRSRVRKVYADNPNYSIYTISEITGVSSSQVADYLSNNDLYLTPSFSEANIYFLFTSILEKKIITDIDKNVQNGFQFSQKEKDFIKSFGLTFKY